MFVQYIVNLLFIWGCIIGIGYFGFMLFNCGGVLLIFDLFNKLDWQMNVYGFIFGLIGFGKLVFLINFISQMFVMYLLWMFVVEVGNSFGLLVDFVKWFGFLVYCVCFVLGFGVSLVLFVDVIKLVESFDQVKVLDVEDIEVLDLVQGSKVDFEDD